MQTIVLKEKWDCYKDSPIFWYNREYNIEVII